MKCPKCKYSTSCLRTMIGHTTDCLGPHSELNVPQKPLDQEMHCVCGFSSSEGNALARHLATCGRSTAYPTVEAAQENTVKRNMLDMLGLVRRDEDDDDDESLGGSDGALLVVSNPKKNESTTVEEASAGNVVERVTEEPSKGSDMNEEYLDTTTTTTDQAESAIDEPMEVVEENAEATKEAAAFNAALTLDDLASIASTAELDQTTPICSSNTYQTLAAPVVPIEGDVDHLQKQQIEQFMDSL